MAEPNKAKEVEIVTAPILLHLHSDFYSDANHFINFSVRKQSK